MRLSESALGRRNRFLLANMPATPSDFILHLREFVADKGRLRCVIHARVSRPAQAEHLKDILAFLRCEAKKAGVTVVGEVGHVVQGWRELGKRDDLEEARSLATEHGAFVLAESTSRFLRSADFHPWDREGMTPSEQQFCELTRWFGRVTLVTALDPDASAADVKRHESTVRAGFASRKRTYLPRVSEEDKELARRMHAAGKSIGEIATHFERRRSVIQYWLP